MVGLIRVSKVGDRGDDLLSPDLQRTAIEAYAGQTGKVVTEWIEALDESGSQARSPWWRRLDEAVGWVEDGRVDGILVWKFSRAARHRRKWAVALDRVELAGGVLESATEQLDTRTSTGRLARGMLAELAAWEAEVKGEQWREVATNRLARGLPASGRSRFGYVKRDDGVFAPDPQLAPVIVALYERYVQGDTFVTLAAWLHEQGVTTSGGATWTPSHVRQMLDSGFAAGLLRHNGETHHGVHEAIVSPALWADYQRVRATARRMPPRTRGAVHPLAGLIKCGVCGGPACREVKPGKRPGLGPYVRYRCCARNTFATACPASKSISAEAAIDGVKAWLQTVAGPLDQRARALADQKARATRVRADAGKAQRELDRLDAAIAQLAVQAAQGLLPGHSYAIAADELVQQRAAAEEELRRAQEDAHALAQPAARTARSLLGSWDELVAVDPKGVRDVLAALIARVEIHPGEQGRNVVRVIPRWEA